MWDDYDWPDITEVETVSQLRHYLNCTDDYKSLSKKFKCSHERIDYIYDNLRGPISVKHVLKHFKEYKEEVEERERSKAQAEQKNRELQKQLEYYRENLCSIGTRKVKLLLNKKIKEGDKLAESYRVVLEIEDKNISAKKIMNKYHEYGYQYADKVYKEKHNLIHKLVGICEECGYKYGYEECSGISTNAIVYFELPNMKQVSFHDELGEEELKNWKKYDSEWDGKENSTLLKIQETLTNVYNL